MLLILMYGFYCTTLFVGLVLLLASLYQDYQDYQAEKQAEKDLKRFYALYGGRLPEAEEGRTNEI